MSAGFAFAEDVTVTRVVSTLEYGAIFVGETPAGDKVRVRYLGRTELPVAGDTFAVKVRISRHRDR